ncbi:MAG: hypothetical protein KDJ88_04360 [Bauldia sp.]|nr:hypothetical protein [Bauldia sp.]
MRRAAIALGILGGAAAAAAAQDGSTVLDILPAPVREATWCAEEGPGFATRRSFAGFTVFAVQCPGNNANFIEAVVVADDEGGTNARALVFPTPDPASPDVPYDTLSNIRWLDGGVLGEVAVDPEVTDGPCRHEAQWRLEGARPDPKLIFWRETTDCDGDGGWVVRVAE